MIFVKSSKTQNPVIMRFDYYRDYTDTCKLAKRIYNFIERIKQNAGAKFDFFECCKFLRWTALGRDINKKLVQTSIRHDYANEIIIALRFLKQIKAIKDYKVDEKEDNYIFEVELLDFDSWDKLIENSIYYPLEGELQKLTPKFIEKKEKLFDINYYQDILDSCKKDTYKATALEFAKFALYEWEDTYEVMKNKEPDRIDIEAYGFKIAIDMGYTVQNESNDLVEWQDERVIAIAGFSRKSRHNRKRNVNRLAGYRKRFFTNWADKQIDVGHYIAHTIWDDSIGKQEIDLEFNLYPQKRALNQGHSEEGKLYRKMEQYCADNSEVFLFVRPIYGDLSLRPFVIEYGILKPDLTLWIEQFVNI
jgi:hypothetical protein